MIGIEVMRDGQIWLLQDRPTVARMVRIGQLGPVDRVREIREGAWTDASSVDWLTEAFQGDPWDAWEELDGVDPEQIWADAAVPVEVEVDPADDTDVTTRDAMAKDVDAEPLVEPLADPDESRSALSLSFQPAAQPPSSEPPPPSELPSPEAKPPSPTAPEPRVEPPALAASLDESDLASMGQVIEFPNGRKGVGRLAPGSSELPAALLQPLEVQDLVPNDVDSVRVHKAPPPESPRSLAPWLVVMALILCLAAFGLSLWSIQRDAQWTSVRTAAVQPAQLPPAAVEREAIPEVAPPEVSPSADEAEQVTELALLDAELRERIPPSPLDLGGGPDDLESALLIELSNMKLGPVKVLAPVVSWTGARNDVVEVADVEVRLTSSGSIERELAAVGLVLGKYLQHYGFEVRTFSVIVTGQDGISRKRQMEPVAARHLWSGRKDLYEFLTGR